MKNYIKFTFFAAMMIFFVGNVSAQKKITDGSIKYTITDIEGGDQMAAMLKGSTIETFFKGDMVKTDVNMMGGMMRNQNIINSKTQKGTMLMDMMGKKTAVELDMNETKEKTPEYTITYNKKDVKEIAGYKCTRADIKLESGETFVIYLTNKITPPISQLSQQFSKLEGFPLQYQMDQGGLKMTLKATSVSDKAPDNSMFEIPTGYEKMTMDEFRKSMGSMGM